MDRGYQAGRLSVRHAHQDGDLSGFQDARLLNENLLNENLLNGGRQRGDQNAIDATNAPRQTASALVPRLGELLAVHDCQDDAPRGAFRDVDAHSADHKPGPIRAPLVGWH